MNAALIGSIIYNYYYKDEENEMTEHKFTGDDVIKALELHSNKDVACLDKCPYAERHFCGSSMARDALALINRQKAEIEWLNKEVDRLSQCVLYHDGIVSDLEKDVFNAKSEAIKEFAERLEAMYENDKTYDRPNAHTLVVTVFRNIDNLVKEMTEGNNESQNT